MNNYIDNGNCIGLGMTCDVCGRTVRGITYVNGMKFCAKCYQETFGGSKDWQILDKDKTIEELKQENKTLRRALELASSAVSQYIKIVFNTTERDDIKEQYTKEYIAGQYIDRAKKEEE